MPAKSLKAKKHSGVAVKDANFECKQRTGQLKNTTGPQ